MEFIGLTIIVGGLSSMILISLAVSLYRLDIARKARKRRGRMWGCFVVSLAFCLLFAVMLAGYCYAIYCGWFLDEPMAQAADRGNLAAVENYLARGASPDSDIGDHPALVLASEHGYREIVELLIRRGANVDEPDDDGKTALALAAANGRHEMVKLLINKGAAVDARDNSGRTALYDALANGHREIVELLIRKGANVNVRDANGRTALFIAAAKGQREIVELLIRKGANVKVQDYNGRTAVDLARAEHHCDIVHLLEEAAGMQPSKCP